MQEEYTQSCQSAIATTQYVAACKPAHHDQIIANMGEQVCATYALKRHRHLRDRSSFTCMHHRQPTAHKPSTTITACTYTVMLPNTCKSLLADNAHIEHTSTTNMHQTLRTVTGKHTYKCARPNSTHTHAHIPPSSSDDEAPSAILGPLVIFDRCKKN